MCGILGLIGPRSFDGEAFGKALDAMQNRGPDDRGIYEEPECLLGHRRLSILDLSPAGHQPMSSRDGRFIAVFNGEVYNFLELRRELEVDGVCFVTRTDTEVILALYAKEGPACLDRFRGMFAIAIWDRLEKSLFLARDRMGIKPLYIWPGPQSIAFASEVKALRALPGGPGGIAPEAVVQYLAWGHVPAPLTITRGVESMMPATWILWKQGATIRRTYWDFPRGPFLHHSRDEALEVLRPLLREAVAYRCISDAPLGAFLSGGIDSSSVVTLMRAAGQKDLRTFSMSFPQTAWDEGPYALKVAEQFETHHTDVSINAETAQEHLNGFFAAMDQPTCDGFNTYMVSKFARQGGLTVSLSGLGGDELFAGYAHYHHILRTLPWFTSVPRLAERAASWGAGHLNPHYRKLEALALDGPPLSRLYYAARGLFMPSQIRRIVHPDILSQTGLANGETAGFLPVGEPGSSPLHTVMAMELRRYLHDQLLRDSDVFGMAHSLEIRVPFIDHKLTETLFRTAPAVILSSAKHQGPKGLLRDALPGPLPALCINRPKMGFTFPFDAWMRKQWTFTGNVREGVVSPLGSSDLLNREAIQRVWTDFEHQEVHWSRPWSLYALAQL